MNNTKFTPIDLLNWKRGEIFYYFSQMAPTGYSLTVDVDITRLLGTLKKNKLKKRNLFVKTEDQLNHKMLKKQNNWRTKICQLHH